MPDLDDLLEDAFDSLKKQLRKQQKRRKKAQKERKKADDAQRRTPARADADPKPVEAPNRTEETLPQPSGTPGAEPANLGPLAWMRRQFQGPVLQDAVLRAQLQQAEAYAAGIKRLVRTSRNPFNQARMADLVGETDHWQQSLQALAQRVDAYKQNSLLQHDLHAVPQAIQRLETELARTPSPRLTDELTRTLENRRRQLEALQRLDTTMRQAEVKIETTVSMLGAIYSQAHMSQSTGQAADYRRLLAEIEEEARALDDYVAVLAEVKRA